jgi:hypothetical protein
MAVHSHGETLAAVIPGRANGSRECAPDDRLRASPESITTIVSMDSGPAPKGRVPE